MPNEPCGDPPRWGEGPSLAEKSLPASAVVGVHSHAIATLDRLGRVVTWNAGAEALTGYDAGEITGENLAVLYTETDRAADVPARTLTAAAIRGEIDATGWRVRADGTQVWLDGTLTAIDDDGDVAGYVLVGRDRTDEKHARDEHRLQGAVSQAVTAAGSLEAGLQAALREVCTWTDWVVGQAWLPSDGDRLERLDASYAESPVYAAFDTASETYRFAAGEGLPGRVLATGEPVWFPDVSTVAADVYPRARQAAAAGLKAGLGVPIIADGEVAVVLEFYMADRRERDERLVDVVAAVATELGGLVAHKHTADALARERELVERILAAVSANVVVIDPDGQIVRANEQAKNDLEIGRTGIEHAAVGDRDVYDESGRFVPPAERPYMRVFETGEPISDWQCQMALATGENRWFSVNAVPLFAADDRDVARVVVTVEDITQLKEQARQLRRQRDDLASELDAVFERIDDAVFALDDDLRFTFVNERTETLLDRDAASLVDRHLWDVVPSIRETPLPDRFQAALTTQEPTSIETYIEPLDAWVEAHGYPSDSGLSVYLRDVTDRKRRERQLREERDRFTALYESIPEAIVHVRFVDGEPIIQTVNSEFESVFGYPRDELEGRSLNRAIVPADRAAEAAEIDRVTTSLERIEQEVTRSTADGDRAFLFRGVPFETGGEAIEGIGVYIDITERIERERELELQREQLAALDELNGVVRGINEALVRQSTREEIEQVVCNRLAAAESYRVAWVGAVEPGGETIRVAATAGTATEKTAGDGDLEVDQTAPDCPAAAALRSGEIQTRQALAADELDDPLLAGVDGVQAAAAIPIAHEDTLYGVLTVYAERPRAFDTNERAVVGQLGDVVGHAIASLERKRALMSDEIVEIEFLIQDVHAELDGVEPTDGRIVIDQAVPVGADRFIVYGTVTTPAVPTLEALADRLPYAMALTVLDGSADASRFELQLAEPPVFSELAAHGGHLGRATIADGDYRLSVALPPHSSVQRMIEVVRETYPDAEVIARRQVTRRERSLDRIRRALEEDLTDRQRAALEAAHYAGFFEWPRDRSGEDLADAMGIAPATFHQHLRAAQRTLVAALFPDESAAA